MISKRKKIWYYVNTEIFDCWKAEQENTPRLRRWIREEK